MGAWLQDLRFAARGLARRPGFTAGVAITLGLGIGATTTVYSVVDGVLLRPLSFEEPSRLALVGTTFPTREWADEDAGLQHLAGMAMLNFRDYAARNRSFESLTGIERTAVLLPDDGEGPELVSAARVGADFFEMFGATPALGRGFLPSEHSVDAERVVILSHGAWWRRFGADPGIVGRPLRFAGSPVTVVGVLPEGFEPPEAIFGEVPDFWLPLEPDHARYAERGMRSLYVAGRLQPGTDLDQARAEARTIGDEIAADFPEGNVYPDGSHFGIGINGLKQQTVGTAGRPLRIFLGAAALLLALASMNAATLLLARSLDRVGELEVRRALGAGRARVSRLLLTEAGILALLAGVVGVGLAAAAVELFVRYAPSFIPRVDEVALDGRILGVAALISLATGVLAGSVPAVRLTDDRIDRGSMGARFGGAEPASRIRALLVGAQITVAVILVSGAALLSSSFVRITTLDPGFDPDGLISMRVDLKRPGAPPDEEAWQAWDGVLTELEAVPGVESVAGTTNPPFQSPFWAPRVLLPDDPPDVWREGVAGYAVTPGYVETIGARLVEGRALETSDGPDSAPVALVNEAFVRELLPGTDPLGMVIRQREGDHQTELHVVGVVADMVQTRAEDGFRPAIYVPYTQADWPFVQVVVRSDLPPETLVPELRAAVARFSATVPPRDVRTLTSRRAATWTTPRFQTLLSITFGGVALLLAALGLYGSLSHAVRRRRPELGVRLALGAGRAGLLRLVVGQGLRVVSVGALLGVLGTVALGRVLATFLFGVEPNDPLTLAGVVFVLLLVSLVACAVPARRAGAVDPVEVLRGE